MQQDSKRAIRRRHYLDPINSANGAHRFHPSHRIGLFACAAAWASTSFTGRFRYEVQIFEIVDTYPLGVLLAF